MNEKELLKKAFEYGNVPSLITYCFTEPCPMKDKCIHYLSGLYKNEKTDRGGAIFPNALKNGNCKYFAPLRVVKMAWGFDKLFAEIKVKDAPALRAEMRDYLGSKGLPLQTGTTETPPGTAEIYQTALRQIRI